MVKDIVFQVQNALKENVDEKTKASSQKFFKEEIKNYGVKTATVTQISKTYYKRIESKSKSEIFELCEELWRSGYIEETFVACHWSYLLRKQYEPSDFLIFEKWIHHYVDNWASCDTLCNHTVGSFIERYPEHLEDLKVFTASENRWMRRAAAVTLIVPARKGKFLKEILELANLLLMDQDDLVQKGYGWMLKAASEVHQQEIFDFVMSKKNVMPRTALRYAIEKMPKEMKALAMVKDK
ncbi:DNA alkylation repair protein [Acidaminobacter sp.]|uniref:DNA alkylation repair protein n=1 Tax=Acidaminobacter sp. TaxID=1872102 RepID=UPI00255E9C1C|nr:DNA alkylation repair protein [Acidaminobacter sp.]MDK9712354.1 DNA alkylation repair protein [Acidaminobacter sp.]